MERVIGRTSWKTEACRNIPSTVLHACYVLVYKALTQAKEQRHDGEGKESRKERARDRKRTECRTGRVETR